MKNKAWLAKILRFAPQKVTWKLRFFYGALVFVWGFWGLLTSFSVPSYVQALSQSSQLFEEHYVDPANVKITFPEKKRNLIHIYLESMENTVASQQNGGRAEQSIIPELEALAVDKNNLSFSHTDSGLGGILPAQGTTWTVAGLTAQNGGIPLKDGGILGRNRNGMGDFNEFLPGAYTSGDILKEAGYNQSFVMGSDAAFGGRDKLLTQHGGYNIIDFNRACETGKIAEDYKVWWGYEDKKLFDYAKEEATRLAGLDQPFNLQLLTVDTHYVDGWLDETCPEKYDNKYDNVHACSSSQVGEFVAWLKQQPFFENTTVVITGDHLGMQTEYYDQKIAAAGDSDYQRSVYNVIINSAAHTDKTFSRQFTSFDIYPTVLTSIGAKIDGNRLGLGVDLFSGEATLTERFGGIDALNAELSKRSNFYERRILIRSDN